MKERGKYASGREAVRKVLEQPRFVIDPVMRGDTVDEEPVHHWTINVARAVGGKSMQRWVHAFRTQPMHITREEAAQTYATMVKAFPAPEWDVQLDAHVEYAITVKPRRIA